tara:strand:- start:443 stop:853 length:411 start_codon:yes stop_codon:yes gene_type:complete
MKINKITLTFLIGFLIGIFVLQLLEIILKPKPSYFGTYSNYDGIRPHWREITIHEGIFKEYTYISFTKDNGEIKEERIDGDYVFWERQHKYHFHTLWLNEDKNSGTGWSLQLRDPTYKKVTISGNGWKDVLYKVEK